MLSERHYAAFEAFLPSRQCWYGGYAYPARTGISVCFRDVTDERARDVPALRDDDLVTLVPPHNAAAEAALAILYDRYSTAVYGLGRRMLGDGGAAEDLLQETFWRLWEHAETYQPGRVRFATWLLRIAANLAISELRRTRRRPLSAEYARGSDYEGATSAESAWPVALEEHADPHADVPEEVWTRHQHELVSTGLRRLPPEQRQAVELAYFAGLTHAEIAAAQQAPLSTVKTRLALGLRKLDGFLATQGMAAPARRSA